MALALAVAVALGLAGALVVLLLQPAANDATTTHAASSPVHR